MIATINDQCSQMWVFLRFDLTYFIKSGIFHFPSFFRWVPFSTTEETIFCYKFLKCLHCFEWLKEKTIIALYFDVWQSDDLSKKYKKKVQVWRERQNCKTTSCTINENECNLNDYTILREWNALVRPRHVLRVRLPRWDICPPSDCTASPWTPHSKTRFLKISSGKWFSLGISICTFVPMNIVFL
jgi:hypothetical protein